MTCQSRALWVPGDWSVIVAHWSRFQGLATALVVLGLAFHVCGIHIAVADEQRPNIVWISCEDISPHIGCYGDPHAITPHIDQLAKEGTRYNHAFTTAGVCAPCRSGIITGMYQTSIGTHHMRCNAVLPEFIKPFPVYLRQAGYYCTNNSKTDYQFTEPATTWDESSGKAHWRNRDDPDQPFFSVFNFTGCHESGIANEEKYRQVTRDLTPDQRQIPELLTTFPPYYPDTPVAREDWKRNYELITAMDAWADGLMEELREDGLYENTIIFFWSDHGVGLPRAKRWLYDSGTHIPLIVRIPEKYRVDGQGLPGSVSDQLVSSIDFGPTVLNLAGAEQPEYLQGQPFLGKHLPPKREYVYGARDRMDERYDIIRMVRDGRFKYIRNYEPLKTFYQYMNTPEKGATMGELRRLHDSGTLGEVSELFFAPQKSTEELYDCIADPHEIHNLAVDPQYADQLAGMRAAHLKWVEDSKDLGLMAEPIIVNRESAAGSRYAILRQEHGDDLAERLAATAVLASSGIEALAELIEATDDEDAAVRYWAAVGIGNIGSDASSAADRMHQMLKDDSPTVQIAAARALCRMGQPQAALPVLTRELNSGAEWAQLHAAIVLDEINEQARPVLSSIQPALSDEVAKNKYVIRVVNRALNELLGTSHQVP